MRSNASYLTRIHTHARPHTRARPHTHKYAYTHTPVPSSSDSVRTAASSRTAWVTCSPITASREAFSVSRTSPTLRCTPSEACVH